MALTEERQKLADERARKVLERARLDQRQQEDRIQADQHRRQELEGREQEDRQRTAEQDRQEAQIKDRIIETRYKENQDKDNQNKEIESKIENQLLENTIKSLAENEAYSRETLRNIKNAQDQGLEKEAALLQRLAQDGYVIEETRIRGNEVVHALDNGAEISFTRGDDGDIAKAGVGKEQEEYFQEAVVKNVENQGPPIRKNLGNNPELEQVANTLEEAKIKYFIRPTSNRKDDEKEIVIEKTDDVIYKDKEGLWKKLSIDENGKASIETKSPEQLVRDVLKNSNQPNQERKASSGRKLLGWDIQEHDLQASNVTIDISHSR